MALKRVDNVGIVVDDLGGTIDFFRELGLPSLQTITSVDVMPSGTSFTFISCLNMEIQ